MTTPDPRAEALAELEREIPDAYDDGMGMGIVLSEASAITCAAALRALLASTAQPTHAEMDAGLSEAHSESYRLGWRAGYAASTDDRATVDAFGDAMASVPAEYAASASASSIWIEGYLTAARRVPTPPTGPAPIKFDPPLTDAEAEAYWEAIHPTPPDERSSEN